MIASPLSVLIFWRTLLFGVRRNIRTCSKVLLHCSWCIHQFSRAWVEGVEVHHIPSRSTDLRHRDVFLRGNGTIVVCGCTGKMCQIRWTGRLPQALKDDLLRCIGWIRLPGRRLTAHEGRLRDTCATRNVLGVLFPCFTIYVKANKLHYDLKSRGDVWYLLYVQLSLVGRPRYERSCFKPESYKFKEQKLKKKVC
jgi:hypothetical protein